MITIECNICGKEVKAKHKNKKFCDKCKYERDKESNRKSVKRVNEGRAKALGQHIECETCGKTFIRDHSSRKFCSIECKQGIDGKYHVYILPEIKYAGMSNRPRQRFEQHRSKKGITKMKIIASYDCPKKAHLHETQLHVEGYDGFFVERHYL